MKDVHEEEDIWLVDGICINCFQKCLQSFYTGVTVTLVSVIAGKICRCRLGPT